VSRLFGLLVVLVGIVVAAQNGLPMPWVLVGMVIGLVVGVVTFLAWGADYGRHAH